MSVISILDKIKEKINSNNSNKSFNTLNKHEDKVGTVDFYTELLFGLIKGGNIEVPEEEIPEGYFFYSTNKIFTKTSVKKVFIVSSLPKYIDDDFFFSLKYRLMKYGKMRWKMRVEPYEVDLNKYSTKLTMRSWERKFKAYENRVRPTSITEEVFQDAKEKEIDDLTVRMIQSWKWLMDALDNNKQLCKVDFIVELVSDNLKDFMEMEKIFKHSIKLQKVKVTSTFLQTNEYFKNFHPLGRRQDGMLRKMSQSFIVSTDIVSKLVYIDKGIVGDEEGMYFGTDIKTQHHNTINVKVGTNAFNVLITGETGSGKSLVNKVKETFYKIDNICSINIDYEGDEYTNLGRAHGAKFISLTDGSSEYFDTSVIAEITGNKEIDEGLFNEAKFSTKSVFDVLVDPINGMDVNQVGIFSRALYNMYKNLGVYEDDMSTWGNSKGSSYKAIYDEIKRMGEDEDLEERREHIKSLIYALEVYFEDFGLYNNTFKNKVDINEILGFENVVFVFGMRGKDENSIDIRSLALRQLMVGDLINKICNYNYTVLGKRTRVTWEEIQRYIKLKNSGEMLVNQATGGRKRGIISYFVTNNPLEIAEAIEDGNANMRALKSNIQCRLIGKFDDISTVERVAKAFDLDNCVNDLKRISNDKNLAHCFLYDYNKERTIVKFKLPTELHNDPIYLTRKDQKE